MTTISDIIGKEVPAFLERTGQRTVRILEVGVLRVRDDEHRDGDGHSTLAFATLANSLPGSTFTGIDLEPSDARGAVDDAGLGKVCTFLRGDSVEMMQRLADEGERFNVIYLDADNSASATMREYMLAQELLHRPGLIMGDDMNTDHPEVRKGRVLIPYLQEDGAVFKLLVRHTPWDTRDILVQEVS